MEGIEFVHPNIFYFMGISFLALFLYTFFRKKTKKQVAIRTPFFQDLKKAEREVGILRNGKLFILTRWALFILTVVLLSVALARPQDISVENKISKNGVDILIALDVSESMLAEDLKPNRIESAKKYIGDFVSKLKNDRVGLEVFAGKPFTQSPMSFDYNVVRYYLSEISTDTINQRQYGLGGTAIGDAILSAVNRFKNSSERTKVLILLTDGEANVGVDPVFASEYARTNGIKIYTIGLGKKEGAFMPVGIKNGKKIYARNSDGSLYKTKFDEQTLKDISQISGGEYFWAGDNGALKNSLKTIGKLEKKEYEAETVVQKKDLFFNWLLWGFISALGAGFLLVLSQEYSFLNALFKKKKI